MLDLNDIAVFARVVEAGSFTAAAHLLGMPKTTVSRRVAAEVRRASPYSKPIAIRAEPEVDCLRLMTCVEMRPIEGAII